ncbi:hypothetical protein Tco_0542249 [Tanacetum coccineum]
MLSHVMSTPAYVDSETITQANRTQSSRVPVPLLDDPYVAVRQAQLVDTDTESDLEKAPLEAEESQPLGSRVPLVSEEFETFEPLGTRTGSSHSSASSDSTTPLSPDHPLTYVSPTRASFHHRTACMTVRAQPAMSPSHSARIAEAMALLDSAFCKRYRSSYETPSPSPSLTLPVQKRYRGTSELILDIDSEGDELGDKDTDEDGKDESLGANDEREREEEEAVPEGQQQAVPVADTTASGPLGLGYRALRCCEISVGEDQVDPKDDRVYTDILIYPPVAPIKTPPSLKWLSGSLPISPSSPVGAQLELHGSILHDHTQRLDALPPTLIADIDRDVRDLYTRSGVVRDEIFSQRQRFKSLEREQERVALTFRALENHDLRMQLAEERRERLELAYRVARMERRQESREECMILYLVRCESLCRIPVFPPLTGCDKLANLIANLKLDIDEIKKIQKQLRKANATLSHELNESKYALTESNDIRDRFRSALHQKKVELEKYITYKNCPLEKEEIERKYKETLDILAQQKHQSHEALKTQAYETFQFKEKNVALIH